MARLTKKQKEAHAKLDSTKALDINAASALIKEITNVKFDASVDIAVRLGVDPRKANQMVRGVVTLTTRNRERCKGACISNTR